MIMKNDRNPYSLPSAEVAIVTPTKANRLLFIWGWLFTASLGAVLATPADFISIAFAMVFALASFLIGVLWGSELSLIPRWLLISVCLTVAGVIAIDIWHSAPLITVAFALMLAIASGILGYKSVLSVVHRRLVVFSSVAISYAVGLLLGPIGVFILTVPTVLIVNYFPRRDD